MFITIGITTAVVGLFGFVCYLYCSETKKLKSTIKSLEIRCNNVETKLAAAEHDAERFESLYNNTWDKAEYYKTSFEDVTSAYETLRVATTLLNANVTASKGFTIQSVAKEIKVPVERLVEFMSDGKWIDCNDDTFHPTGTALSAGFMIIQDGKGAITKFGKKYIKECVK